MALKQIAFLIALSVVAGLGTTGRAEAEEMRVPTIVVDGTGSVDAAPDMATGTLGVQARAEAADAALTATSEAAARVLETLSGLGIAARDIQTRAITLNPVYAQRSRDDGEPPEIMGYEASNEVSVRVRALEELGEVLDSVAGAGANNLQGLRFGLSAPEPLRDAARAAAVTEALRQARIYAEAAGLGLGKLLSIEARGRSGGPVMMESASFARAAVPISTGDVSVTDSVTVEIELVAQ